MESYGGFTGSSLEVVEFSVLVAFGFRCHYVFLLNQDVWGCSPSEVSGFSILAQG